MTHGQNPVSLESSPLICFSLMASSSFFRLIPQRVPIPRYGHREMTRRLSFSPRSPFRHPQAFHVPPFLALPPSTLIPWDLIVFFFLVVLSHFTPPPRLSKSTSDSRRFFPTMPQVYFRHLIMILPVTNVGFLVHRFNPWWTLDVRRSGGLPPETPFWNWGPFPPLVHRGSLDKQSLVHIISLIVVCWREVNFFPLPSPFGPRASCGDFHQAP